VEGIKVTLRMAWRALWRRAPQPLPAPPVPEARAA